MAANNPFDPNAPFDPTQGTNPFDPNSPDRNSIPTPVAPPQQLQAWDPAVFQNIVGRPPTDAETQYYSNRGPGWVDEVRSNTPNAPPPVTAPAPPGTPPPPGPGPLIDPNTPGGTPTGTAGMPAGIDPNLWAIYQKGGLTPAGRGSGFADWQYWQDKPSQWGRLAADIAGTGTDNPQGTPGQGAWSSSGRNASPSGGTGALGSLFGGGGGPGAGIVPGAGLDSATLAQLFSQLSGGLPAPPNTDIPIPSPDAYETQLRQSIMQAIQEGQSPVTANDPSVAPLLSAIQGQAQRAIENNQQTTAARLFGQGVPVSSGAYDTATGGFAQATNEGTQGQTAALMAQQLTDRRNRLMTALNLGSNYLNAQQSRVLQAELANVNNALASYGIRTNASMGLLQQLLENSHFYDQLGTNANIFAQGQNAGALGALG